MKAVIVVNEFLRGGSYAYHADWFKSSFESLGIHTEIMTNRSLMLRGVSCDFVLYLDKDLLLAKRLESEGARLFNSAEAIAVCDSKAESYLAFLRGSVRIPETVLAPMTYENIGYTDLEFLDDVESRISYPMVVKEHSGSFGSGVFLAKNREELEGIVKGRTHLLFQRFVSECFGRDIRVIVCGGKAIACMERVNTAGDFRSNVALGASAKKHVLTSEQEEAAIRAAASCGCFFCGVDLLPSSDGVLTLEVNSNAHMRAVRECTGIDTALIIAREIEACIK